MRWFKSYLMRNSYWLTRWFHVHWSHIYKEIKLDIEKFHSKFRQLMNAESVRMTTVNSEYCTRSFAVSISIKIHFAVWKRKRFLKLRNSIAHSGIFRRKSWHYYYLTLSGKKSVWNFEKRIETSQLQCKRKPNVWFPWNHRRIFFFFH